MAEQSNTPVYDLEKIYLKDVSFESPESPRIFLQKDFKPEINVDINVEHRALDAANGYFEVALNTEVKASANDKIIFLVAVQQAGIFKLQGFNDDQMPVMLEVACPNTLLPFTREVVAELATKGGFPQLLLAPVNFDLIHKNKQARAQVQADEQGGEQVTH